MLILAVVAALAGAKAAGVPIQNPGTLAIFPPLALALVTAFIVFNKVGSPQYLTWIAVPLVAGLVLTRRRVLLQVGQQQRHQRTREGDNPQTGSGLRRP